VRGFKNTFFQQSDPASSKAIPIGRNCGGQTASARFWAG
jgi:hypothetical protein